MKFAFSKVAQAAGVAALALAGLSASAATQTFTFTSNGGVPYSPNWGSYDGTNSTPNVFSFAQFDQSGGDTLTGVTIEWAYAGTVDMDYLNSSGSPRDVSATATQKLRINGWGMAGTAAVSNLNRTLTTDDINGGDPLTVLNLANGASTNFGYESIDLTDSGTLSFTSGSVFNGFLGTGNLSYIFGSQGSTTLYGAATGVLTALQMSTAAMTVTYTYTEAPVSSVPEPGSYALMLAGLAAVGAVSRRRRVK